MAEAWGVSQQMWDAELKCSKKPMKQWQNIVRAGQGIAHLGQLILRLDWCAEGMAWQGMLPAPGSAHSRHRLWAPRQQRSREAGWQALVTVPKQEIKNERGKQKLTQDPS